MASHDTAPAVSRAADAGENLAISVLLGQLADEVRLQAQKRTPDDGAPADLVAPAPVASGLIARLQQRFNLPTAYCDLLRALGSENLTITPGPFQAIVLHAAPSLEVAQVGFRGSRLGDEGFIAPHGWRRAWVVIATDAGDPYFLDVSKTTPDGECPVLTAMQGTGTWEPRLAASSLAQFLRILRVWTRIVGAHYDPQNPDEPLDDAHSRRLASEIGQIDAAALEHWAV